MLRKFIVILTVKRKQDPLAPPPPTHTDIQTCNHNRELLKLFIHHLAVEEGAGFFCLLYIVFVCLWFCSMFWRNFLSVPQADLCFVIEALCSHINLL